MSDDPKVELRACPFCGTSLSFRAEDNIWNHDDPTGAGCILNGFELQDGDDIAFWDTRPPVAGPPREPTGEMIEMLDTACGLIQEAKGADGPDGGFVTNHLDAAENWIDKVRAALDAAPRSAPDREAVIEALQAAVEKAAKTFRTYAQMHYAKKSDEGDAKGVVNDLLAEEMETAVAKGEQP